MSNILSSREKKIILLIITSKTEITIKGISEEIGVSRRTILREMSEVYNWFSKNGYEVNRNSNKGLILDLSLIQESMLLKKLDEVDTIHYHTKHERQLFIITELLQTKESLKLLYFATVLNVSEATISHDLNDVEVWFEKYDLVLERKQGYGVLVIGRERSKRKALISILYEMLDGQQLKNAVSSQLGLNKPNVSGSTANIRNKLLNMINFETVKVIEAVITESETDMGFKFAESSYTALAVHLALAIKRIENGEKIVIKEEILENIRMFDEYVIALKLTKTIEKHMNVTIPEDETGYVTMHLKGARYKNGLYDTSVLKFNEMIISNYQLTSMINEMIKIAENLTGYKLKQVDSLLIGLVDHLRPAISRMQMNLDIRNPLLKKIKTEYTEIFDISKEACKVLDEKIGIKLPESEIGYIAMHIGSAIEQIKNKEDKSHQLFNIIVTCISGIGTSKMLAERIKNEYNNLNIVEVFSTTSINDNWLIKNDIDLIVSTVHFENNVTPVISVNPLLLDKDIDRINKKLFSLSMIVKEDRKQIEVSSKEKIKSINEYSGAIVELLDNISFYQDIGSSSYDEFIDVICSKMAKENSILKDEILKREAIGSIIFKEEKVSFLHTRSSVVDCIKIGIFRNEKDVNSNGDIFNTALVMIAPLEVSKEKLEVVGEISSRVVSEANFLKDIKYDDFDHLYMKIEGFLNQFFNRKLKRK